MKDDCERLASVMDSCHNLLYAIGVIFVVAVLLTNYRISQGFDRIKALEKQLEKKVEAPKPDYDKYRECCAYYPD